MTQLLFLIVLFTLVIYLIWRGWKRQHEFIQSLKQIIEAQTKVHDGLKDENALLQEKIVLLDSMITIYKFEETQREAEEKRSML